MHRQEKKVKIEDLQSMLKDHYNYPNSVCRRCEEGESDIQHIEIIASVILDMEKWKMHLCESQPCENIYRLVPFTPT
jgi:hypothetical protein